ncbi:hypothetical protein K437DRAFT_36477 [Tilletiaria anomala UBC 951]|uniref:Uncharacterized protein n=1 Tax=Tilletiaria anomala (strain ATCC 24038 / CBS 436.72 / UBC 951) TaxID=1037660 RepID=A0A066V7D5_TILAU|nr:uncharacterized protein K437DRAFT_36477 [Tilletiaria anomala UBC 951]KDN37657.1 hypothetical protein K437DRAFT_36477 [Tilletiaria anomala UBC 951]
MMSFTSFLSPPPLSPPAIFPLHLVRQACQPASSCPSFPPRPSPALLPSQFPPSPSSLAHPPPLVGTLHSSPPHTPLGSFVLTFQPYKRHTGNTHPYTMTLDNLTVSPVAALVSRLQQAASSQSFGNTSSSVASLLVAAKPQPAAALMLSVAIAFTLTALTMLLALFEMGRCIYSLATSQAQLRGLAKLKIWLRSWRWIYALLLLIASVVEAVYLILYLETRRGVVGRQAPMDLSVIAFGFYSTAAAFIVIMIGTGVASDSPAPASVLSVSARARRVLCTATGSLSCCLSLGWGAWVLVNYGAAARQLDGALSTLILNQGECDEDDADCGANTLTQRLSSELKSLGTIDAFKGISLLILGVLILWTSYELLVIRHQEALAEKAACSTWAATVQEKSYNGRSFRSRTSATGSTFKAKRRSSGPQKLEDVPVLCRQASTASTSSSWYSSVDSEAMKAPPSYTARSRLHTAAGFNTDEEEDDETASTPGAYRARVKGRKLDTSAEFGAELQRKFGTTSATGKTSVGYFNHHDIALSDGASDNRSSSSVSDGGNMTRHSSVLPTRDGPMTPSLSQIPKLAGYVKSSRYSGSSASVPSYTSQMSVDTASALAAKEAEVNDRLAAETRGIRWAAALALICVLLYSVIIVLKACIGPEVDLGDRPGFELVSVVWQAVVSNMHLPILAILMSRGIGFIRSSSSASMSLKDEASLKA